MIVGFHLHQQVNVLVGEAVLAALRVGIEAPRPMSAHYRGVVGIGREHIFAATGVGVADHREQRVALLLAIDAPAGVEDLVPAVLGVRLGEHHQLHITGIAAQGGKAFYQIVDLVIRQGQAQRAVRLLQGGAPPRKHIDTAHGGRLGMLEQATCRLQAVENTLGHAIVKQRLNLLPTRGVQALRQFQPEGGAPLEAANRSQTTVVGDVGGFAGPGGDGPRARHDQRQCRSGDRRRARSGRCTGGRRSVPKQLTQSQVIAVGERCGKFGKVDKLAVQQANIGVDGRQLFGQLVSPEGRQGRGTAQDQHAVASSRRDQMEARYCT